MEKPGKHHLIQMISVNTPGDKSVDMFLMEDVMKRTFHLCGFFHKTCNPDLLLREDIKTNPTWKTFYHIAAWVLFKLSKVMKDEKEGLKTVWARRE